MKYFFTTLIVLITYTLNAQYTTPNTGLVINFEYLVAESDGAVTMDGPDYVINEDITISANDLFVEVTSASAKVAPGVLVTVWGGFNMSIPDGFVFTWAEEGNHYEGFRFEDGSVIDVEFVTFEYGGGLRVLTENFRMQNCVVSYQETLASTGGAIGLSSGKPEFINCHFISNVSAAINSGANIAVAPVIENCVFQFNGTSVLNKSQINLGPSGADTTFIRGNVVEGHPDNVLSGGIAFTSLVGVDAHAVIEENEVFNNRYGIAVIGGNLNTVIRGNIIYDNDIQNDPMLGGSGINLNSGGSNYAVISENIITGNLWGMTMQGTSTANLGDTTETNFNIGLNVFEDNGNGGVTYALFNNTPNDIMAMNNCWDGFNNVLTEEDAEAVISHEVDDPSLGLVTFMPLGFCGVVGVQETERNALHVYPNPAMDLLNIELKSDIEHLLITDMTGRVVISENVYHQQTRLEISVDGLPSGVYIVRAAGEKGDFTARFVRQ